MKGPISGNPSRAIKNSWIISATAGADNRGISRHVNELSPASAVAGYICQVLHWTICLERKQT